MITDTKQDMTIMGMKISQNQKQTFYISWTPKRRDKHGNWIVTRKIEGVKLDLEIGGTKIPFDSTNPSRASGPLSEFFKALVGSELTLTLDKAMKVTKIEGRDEFLKKLSATNQQMEPLLKQILSDDSLRQMADSTFSMVPGKPVKKGDVWETKSALDLGAIGKFETTKRFVYKGPDKIEKHLQEIEVEASLEYTGPDPNASGQLPFKILQADLESQNAKGKILFDSQKGRMASATHTVSLTGKIIIEIGGKPANVELEQIQLTTLRITDDKPIRKSE
jgi:hypothetical protein